MVHILGEMVIHRPPEEVFDVVADTASEREYYPRMQPAEKITS